MLEELQLRSFKAFSNELLQARKGIRFSPFTTLVGPNGSGKSTLLQAIEILGQLVRGTIKEMLDEHGWEYSDLPHLRSDRPQIELRARIRLSEKRLIRWTLVLGTRRFPGIAKEIIEKRTAPKEWHRIVTREGRSVQLTSERTGKQKTSTLTLPSSWLSTIDEDDDQSDFPTLVELAGWAKRIRAYYFLDPVVLRAPSRATTDEVGPHGEDLAAFLARLRDKSKQRLIARVRDHYPRLVDIQPRRTQFGWTHLDVTEKWNRQEATFNARQVSDGLLRLVAVAAMHEQRTPPSVLLLDEVENGLHPRLLGGLVAMLKELSEAGGTQVIVTTHSPITLNYVPSPEAALLVTRGRGGDVSVTPMSETRNFQQLREHFELGELWYNVGEERLKPESSRQGRRGGPR